MTVGTPLGIGGLVFIGMGVALVIAGVILLIANQNKPKEWYIWFLISLGTVLGILGGVMLAVALADTNTLTKVSSKKEDEEILS